MEERAIYTILFMVPT